MPPTPRTRILGAALRDARVEANYGLRELARRIGISPAILSGGEQAHRTPSLADVAGILGATGTAGETKRDILLLARGAAGESWVLRSAPLSPARSAALRAHKIAAQHVVTWDPVAIPELLQVADRNLEPRSTVIEAFISDQALHAETSAPTRNDVNCGRSSNWPSRPACSPYERSAQTRHGTTA
ncbi:helix-turn-helix domain-containing protein [Amycolatopsis nivea]|uniref:helix-turn-helix domain-containing protein n=1 Tax=Amycolatopsis nivea TaxID=1644109 RepID=UPI001070078B